MAVRVRCPNGHSLSVKDELKGKRVRCPKCKELFRADEVQEVKPAAVKIKKKVVREDDSDIDDDDDSSSASTPEERRKNRQRDKRDNLRKVNLGLLIHTVKMWCVAVFLFFAFLTRIFDVTIEFAKSPKNAEKLSDDAIGYYSAFENISLGLMLVLLAAVAIAGIAGSVYCCMIPKKSEARTSILTSLVFDAILLIASLLIPMTYFNVFGLTPDRSSNMLKMLMWGSGFFGVAGLFLFQVYLRQLAVYIHKTPLGVDALNLLSWLMLMAATAPVVAVSMTYLAPIFAGILGSSLTLGMLFLLTIVWFAVFYYIFFQGVLALLTSLREAIAP